MRACSHSLFTSLLKEKLGKRSGHANYLVFISTSLIYGKNQQVRQSNLWSKDWKDMLEGILRARDKQSMAAWFKVIVTRWKGPLFQRALSCKELFLTKSCLYTTAKYLDFLYILIANLLLFQSPVIVSNYFFPSFFFLFNCCIFDVKYYASFRCTT